MTYSWVGGQSGNRETQRQYTFREGGTQPVICNVEISVNEASLAAGDPLIQRIRRFSAVDVEVEGEIPVPKVELVSISLTLRLQPYTTGESVVTDPKAFNGFVASNQDFPDMLDGRTLPLGADGSFSYSGLTSYQYGVRNRRTTYSGRIDLEKWVFTVSGTFSYSGDGKGMYGAWSQSDAGDFTVEAPICALDVKQSAGIKIKGTVSTSYQDEKNGGRAQKLALTTRTGRRLTDDIHGCITYRNPEFLRPEFRDKGGLEWYNAGDNLDREAYLKLKGKAAFVAAGGAAPGASTAGGGATGAGGATTGNPPAAPSGGYSSGLPTSTGPSANPSANPGAISPGGAGAPTALVGRGSVTVSAGLPTVSLTNEGSSPWTKCVVALPGGFSSTLGTLPAGTGRDFPLTQFRPDANSPGLSGEATVQCAEGSLKFPVNAGASRTDSLANRAKTGVLDGAKAATDAATKAAADASKKASDAAQKARDAAQKTLDDAKKALDGLLKKP